MTISASPAHTIAEWRALLDAPDSAQSLGLHAIYGDNTALCDERCARIARALNRYHEAFGESPVRLFRAPGRINLRGMHVDTHGGWLNLMTHQREILIVAGLSPDGETHVVNTDPAFSRVDMSPRELPSPAAGQSWSDFITSSSVRGRLTALPGHWRNYLEGAWLRARFAQPERDIGGLQIVVDSNLPQGAALSSSAALCIALLHAWFGWHDAALRADELILAAQDAEWYTGSRCGTCDQAAIILGQLNAIIHVALHPKAFSTEGARTIDLPDALRVLVINSYTRRSISGAEKVAYTTNRFAYSMAMEIFQEALRTAGYEEEEVAECDRLSNISAEFLGGPAALYQVLRAVPAQMALDALRDRFQLPDLDREYTRYFSDVPAAQKPTSFGLRGPLLFGIAESERARYFAIALEAGEFAHAGQLMTSGHEGDRKIDREGKPVVQRADDSYLEQMAACQTPVEHCPGVYGASSPALDALVDVALEHGALGASLTGAGIAGTVLALCRAEDSLRIAEGVRNFMAGEAYRNRAGLTEPLTPAELAEAVLENIACAGAGEIRPKTQD